MSPPFDTTSIIAEIRVWLERAVIGLNLCPFAKAVYLGERVRYCVSAAATGEALLADLRRELLALHAADPQCCETTLLIHPQVLTDFLAYNDFLAVADAEIESLALAAELQIASFHPGYQFAGTTAEDITNFTNRSPYPLLHLLRQSSVDRAVAAFPDAAAIFEVNIETMRRLGRQGWDRMMQRRS